MTPIPPNPRHGKETKAPEEGTRHSAETTLRRLVAMLFNDPSQAEAYFARSLASSYAAAATLIEATPFESRTPEQNRGLLRVANDAELVSQLLDGMPEDVIWAASIAAGEVDTARSHSIIRDWCKTTGYGDTIAAAIQQELDRLGAIAEANRPVRAKGRTAMFRRLATEEKGGLWPPASRLDRER